MSLGRRYDITRYHSVLLRDDTPGRYRKLSDDEIALEWERSRMHQDGNVSPTTNDAETRQITRPARDGGIRPTQSLNAGKKKDKAGKRLKSQSLSGKEEKLLRDIPVRQEKVVEDVPGNASFTSSEAGQPTTLDVDLTLITTADAKELELVDADQTILKPIAPIIVPEVKLETKVEKPKKEKKTKVKDKKKSKSKRDTCEVHKHRKHKDSKLKKFFDTNKKSDEKMSSPRHCRSCTCDLAADGGGLDSRGDTSDSSSLSSSHHEDNTSCRSQKHSDTASISSSHHGESASPMTSSTPRDLPKHKTSSASDKSSHSSSHSSSSGTKLKVKPEKPQRSGKSSSSTSETGGSDSKESPREQVIVKQTYPSTSAKRPDKDHLRLNESAGGDSEGYASDGRTPGLICLTTDDPVLLQDGGTFEVISGNSFNRDSDTDTGTYLFPYEDQKDEVRTFSPETEPGPATQLQPLGDTVQRPDTSIISVRTPPPPQMTSTTESGSGVTVRGSGIALPIITVPVETAMAYPSQLRPPAGFKESDTSSSSDEKEEVLATPVQTPQDRETLTSPVQTPRDEEICVDVKQDSPDVRLDLNGDDINFNRDAEIGIPYIEIDGGIQGDVDFSVSCPEIRYDDADENIGLNIPVNDTVDMPTVDLDITPPSPGIQMAIETPELPTVEADVRMPEGKKIALPTGPYVGIVVVSQDSDSSGTDRSGKKGSDHAYKKAKPYIEHSTSASESETSSSTSSSSGGKGKSKAKIEKPKRKGKDKDKTNKKGEKDKTVAPEVPPLKEIVQVQMSCDLGMPPAIRRAEKVEDISKTITPDGEVNINLEPLQIDTAYTPISEVTVPAIGTESEEDKTSVLNSSLSGPELEANAVVRMDLPDVPIPAVNIEGDGMVNGKQCNSSVIHAYSPQFNQTVHAPIPVLDLNVNSYIEDKPEVINKTPAKSRKENRVSQSSDSDTSSSSDHKKKKDKYKFGGYDSDNRDSYLSPLGPLSCHSPLNVSQTLAATSNPNLNGFDKLEASLAHVTPVKVMDTAVPSIVRHRGHFVVVAIDFGTTFSGYALSFTRDPESVHMMRNWEGGDPGVINQKTPTTILLSPEGEFDSFGFTARDRYHNLTPDEAKQWLYFERFKMVLHHKPDLTRDTMLQASNGQPYPALKVFALAIRFFKEHALQQLSDQSGITIINDDVRWVITVPAIWKAPAKQFMRQAAYEADLVSPDCPDQLLIALEPEAASIYCRKLRMYQLVPEHPERRPLQSPRYSTPEPLNDHVACSDINEDVACPPFDLPPDYPLESKIKGTRYMVVDCGGGTVDITVHELGEDTKLKELYKASGGPYGATAVDDEFINMLCDIFGHDFIAHYRIKYPIGWLNLMINFESRKRSASPFKNNSLNVSLPFTFIDYFKKQKGGHIDSVVKKYGNKDVCWSSEGMLRLTPNAMRCLFVPVMEKIKNAIGDILNHPNARNLKYLFLVGGFAESSILQHDLRKEFSPILKVLIPTGVSLAILKGAVLFGLDPTIVNIRRSRLTYGVGVLNRFDPSRHPTSKLVHRDGIDWCTDVFDVFVHVDQPVSLGDTVIRSYTPAKVNQLISVIHIYSSEETESPFITDPGVRKCGTLCLDLSDLQAGSLPNRREIQARMMFGDTEIKVSALDVSTGRCVRASIDFLNK